MENTEKTDSCIQGFNLNSQDHIHYARAFFGMVCPDDLAAERILRQLYPDGAKCASCGAQITGRKPLESFWRGDRTYCSSCDSKFSPRAGTILAESKLSYSQFEIIVVCLSLGADHTIIASLANVHIDTVNAWAAKIRYWESAGA